MNTGIVNTEVAGFAKFGIFIGNYLHVTLTCACHFNNVGDRNFEFYEAEKEIYPCGHLFRKELHKFRPRLASPING